MEPADLDRETTRKRIILRSFIRSLERSQREVPWGMVNWLTMADKLMEYGRHDTALKVLDDALDQAISIDEELLGIIRKSERLGRHAAVMVLLDPGGDWDGLVRASDHEALVNQELPTHRAIENATRRILLAARGHLGSVDWAVAVKTPGFPAHELAQRFLMLVQSGDIENAMDVVSSMPAEISSPLLESILSATPPDRPSDCPVGPLQEDAESMEPAPENKGEGPSDAIISMQEGDLGIGYVDGLTVEVANVTIPTSTSEKPVSGPPPFKTFTCPLCGVPLPHFARECFSCGVEFDE